MAAPWILRSGANWLGRGDLLWGRNVPARPERRALAHEHPEVEVRAMHDDSVLLAVESALSRPAFCNCGDQLRLATRDHALWLECPAFEAPSRLPGGVMHVLRELIHERRHVVDLPELEPEAQAPEFAA